MSSRLHIRIAEDNDLPAITAIHNQAILEPYTNAYTEIFKAGERDKWFAEHKDNCPIYVATENNEVVAWLSISPYRSGRAALSHTKEVSYYVHNDHRGKGVASALLQYAKANINELGSSVYIAVVLDKNAASIKLLEKNGFSLWGHLPNVACFNPNDICGHYYFGWQAGQ
ncbi:MAG: N-acetyltransferase [Bacteroidetes bacterium]|nr:N-acetyltransferase [Bacteroidota bacterium]